MTESNPKTPFPVPPSSSSSSSGSGSGGGGGGGGGSGSGSGSGVPTDQVSTKFSGHKSHINPPDRVIPDTATLRDQWRYAIKQYSKWYAHAWGTAILAGTAFFALGWVIKGENPLPSFHSHDPSPPSPSPSHGDKPTP